MIHHVFANKSNIGDWLSAIGIQQLLAPSPIKEHLCDEPFIAHTLDELSALTKHDCLIVGGGGLFMDYFTPLWQGLEKLALPSPLVIWGAGYCDLKLEPSQPPIEMVRNVARRAKRCLVRDELTRGLLDLPNVPLPIGCPSVCAVTRPAGKAVGLLHVDNYTTVGAQTYDAMDAAAVEFAESTGRHLLRTNNRIEPARRDALAHCLAAYAGSDIVLSSALHGCIIGLAMGRKVLAVSGDWKIEGFMSLLGLGEWVMSQEEACVPGAVWRRLNELSDQSLRADVIEGMRDSHRAVARDMEQHIRRA